MRIEAALKHFSPKSQMFTDSPRATAPDSLDGTGVMTAWGVCQVKAPFGTSCYLGKAGISQQDRDKAVQHLLAYARKTAPALLRKGAAGKLSQCLVVLAKFAYDDYARSAADSVECPDCKGRGVTNTLARVMTHPGCGKTPPAYKIQLVENKCVTCHGKGRLSARCRCGGTGKVRDLKRSKLLGVPVEKDCDRCDGLGFKRQPSTVVFKAIRGLLPELNERTWRRNWKPFYEKLISKCYAEESHATQEFMKMSR
ncbi:antitermination protein [Erwiniaceae bacterium CAU 1747]